ncbi:MAG: CvpA family protein [Oscillospiraceae bacterium]|jgi:uncharacterized membrane protein required for colicin V production|nr:CvpA family protein [Oscillospiraceae bacterium]
MPVEYRWLIWDALALLLIAIMILGAARRGMLRTLVSFAGGILSAVAAGYLSMPAARFLYNAVVRDSIRAVISRQVEEMLGEGVSSGAGWLAALPGWAAGMLREDGGVAMPETAADIIPAVERFIDAALAQPVLTLLRGICFFILFWVFLAIVRYIARALGAVNGIPLVGSLNTVLGGVLGAGEALIALYLLAVLAQAYIAVTGGGGEYVNDSILSRGYLFGFFYRL